MNNAIFSGINWLAVLVAAVAYFMLGAIWFSKLFGKQWIAYHKVDMSNPDAKKGVGGVMAVSFVITLLICIGLAILVARLDVAGWMSGLKIGALTGILFSAATISMTYLYLQKPSGLHFIDGGYHVIGQIIAGIIIASWR
jgi:hypothetical protein